MGTFLKNVNLFDEWEPSLMNKNLSDKWGLLEEWGHFDEVGPF